MNYWQMVTENMTDILAKIFPAYQTSKKGGNSICPPIFAQFVNWRYANDVLRRLVKIHAARQSQTTVM